MGFEEKIVPMETIEEHTNFYTLPRGSDGKLINGSYNRVWKEDKYIGSINLTKIQEYGRMDGMGNLRIRKLTPKECWRLMGFSDESFEKAQSVNSNTQLYKQAGNSIVVDVLEKIINNLHLELEHIKLLELFGGIGACSEAMDNLGLDYEIADYVEIDKYACASYNAIHGTNFLPQDIQEWDKNIAVDFIMHGSPCQDFSLAGKQAGGDEGSGTRSSLMYETIRIVEKLRPKYVLWENVKNVIGKKHRHNFDNYLERMSELGYTNHYQVLNAKDYGVPQNRERVFTLSILGDDEFEFPPKEELKIKLKDVLEDKVDEKYYLSQAMVNYMTGVNQKPSKFPRGERFTSNINRKNQDIGNAVTTNAGNRPTDNFVVEKEKWSDLD